MVDEHPESVEVVQKKDLVPAEAVRTKEILTKMKSHCLMSVELSMGNGMRCRESGRRNSQRGFVHT